MMAKTHVAYGAAVYTTAVGLLGPGLPAPVKEATQSTLAAMADTESYLPESATWAEPALHAPLRLFELATPLLSGGPLADWRGASPFVMACSLLALSALLLLPDLDHPKATLGQRLGPLRGPVTSIAGFLGGGHRKGLHSVFFAAALSIAALVTTWLVPFADVVLAAGLTALGAFLAGYMIVPPFLYKRKKEAGIVTSIAGLVAAAVIVMNPSLADGYWAPAILFLGPLLHDMGDLHTTGKVGILYPLKEPMAVLPKWARFNTGSFVENKVVRPICWTVFTFGACSFLLLAF